MSLMSSFATLLRFVVDGTPSIPFETIIPVIDTSSKPHTGHHVPFDYPVFIHALTPKARFVAVIRELSVEHLQSKHFYFNKGAAAEMYQQALFSRDQTLTDTEAQDPNQAVLSLSLTSRHWGGQQQWPVPHPRLESYSSSCTLQRFGALFGHSARFITEWHRLADCSDGLNEWLQVGKHMLVNHSLARRLQEERVEGGRGKTGS